MINHKQDNSTLPQVTENIARWHHDRNLIDGASDWSQTKKLLEEFTELVAAQMPEQSSEAIAAQVHNWIDDLFVGGRIKSVKVEDAESAFDDAIGDMYVVQTNLVERNSKTMAGVVFGSYSEIKNRKGKMVDGTFVKEADL